jgi:hypothetical protein
MGTFGHISSIGYKPAPAPIERATILPIGRIHAFVGFTASSKSVGSPGGSDLTPEEPDDSSNTLAIDKDGNIDANSNNGTDSILPV